MLMVALRCTMGLMSSSMHARPKPASQTRDEDYARAIGIEQVCEGGQRQSRSQNPR